MGAPRQSSALRPLAAVGAIGLLAIKQARPSASSATATAARPRSAERSFDWLLRPRAPCSCRLWCRRDALPLGTWEKYTPHQRRVARAHLQRARNGTDLDPVDRLGYGREFVFPPAYCRERSFDTRVRVPGVGSLDRCQADSWCQPSLTLSAEAVFPGKQGLVRSGHSLPPHVATHRQPPLTLFGIRERRPSLVCWLQVVVRGGVDGFPPLLRKLGTPFAFEPLLCKRPQQPSLRSQNQRCTVRESRNFPTCTNSSRPTTMTSRLSGRTDSKKLMAIGAGSSTTWCYATLTAGFQKESEFLLCFSCKARSLCPSCDAKRAAAFAAFLQEELLEDVGHAVWTFSIPKCSAPTSSSTASFSPSSPGPATSSWPPPSMITTFAPAWSPPSRHSPTTWFGIRICTASFPEASGLPTDNGFLFPTSTTAPHRGNEPEPLCSTDLFL